MKRPLIPVAFSLVVGILLGSFFVPLPLLFGAAFLLALCFLVWSRVRPAILCALIILAGWIDQVSHTRTFSPHDLRAIFPGRDASVTLHGKLRATPVIHPHHDPRRNVDYWTTSAEIEVIQVREDGHEWQPAFGNIATTTDGALPETFFAGQTVELAGALEPAPGPLADGLFDYRAYLEQKGIYYAMRFKSTNNWNLLASPKYPPLADRFCKWARNALAYGLPVHDESLQLEWALTLGWKAVLSDQVEEPFLKAATYHIFAVDGLRIAIISGIFFYLFRAVNIPRACCGLLVAPLIFFYASMTGWPASAVRAIVMLLVVFGGWLLNRPTDLINSLFAAAVIILVWDPRELFQAGFQLSFFVVLCIILILPFFKSIGERVLRPDPLLPDSLRPRWQKLLHPPARYGIDLLLSSTAAWLGSIPLVALYFHLFTPVSSFSNVIAVPLCGLVLICNLSSLLLISWLPAVAVLFNHAGWFLMSAIRTISQWSANLPAAYWYLPMPSLFTIAVYYGLLLSILTGWLFQGPRRRWKITSAVLLCTAWSAVWLWQRPVTCITILPLEGGQAAFINGPGWRHDWLIDSGGETPADSIVKPYLRAQGVNRLSHFVLTHGEAEFSGGASIICDQFRPREVSMDDAHFRSSAYNEFLASLKTNSLPHTTIHPGDPFGSFTSLTQASDIRPSRADDDPLVLRFETNGVRVLLLSNLSHAGQNALLNSDTNGIRADIVVAGIPDGSEPLGDAFLDYVQPRVIIIADSDVPSSRKASRNLKSRLAQRNLPIFYTSEMRSVTISIRPGHWEVRAMDGTTVSGRSNR